MQYALITGASQGIGLALAVSLAKRKYNLLLAARSEEKLHILAEKLKKEYKIQVYYKVIDLSAPEASDLMYGWIVSGGYQVSILINNAGYGLYGSFEKLSLADQQNMLRINMNFPVEFTYRLLPMLRKNKPAYIMNVASTASYQAVPTLALYAASKAFIVLFTRGLRFELKGSGVSVTCLSPGPVKTGFIDRAGLQAMKETADKFGMEADKLAEIAIRAMFAKRAEVIPGFSNKLGVWLATTLPKSLIETVTANLYNKK